MFGFGYNNGNIGIGTTFPQQQLDISGNIKLSGNIYRDDLLLSATNTSIVRKTFIASDTQSVFDLSYNGIIYSEESEVQVFVNGYKYTYIDDSNKDYNFEVVHDVSYNFTIFRITLNDSVLYGDIVDISVLPGLKFTLEKPGVYQSGGIFGSEQVPINGGTLNINISLVPNAFIELSTGSNPLTINLLPLQFDSSYVGKKGKIYIRERSPDGRLLNVDNRVYFSSLYQAGYTSDVSGNPQIDVLEYEIIKSDLVVGIYEKRVEAYYWDGVNKRLGIGVSNPQYPLHVIGDTRIQGNLIINGTQTVVDTNVNTTEMLDITNDGTGPALRVTQLGVQPIADFCDDSSDNVVMRIADGGNVGIGTTVPKKKLDVVGDISCNWMYGKVRWLDISGSPMQEIPVGTVVMVDSSSTVLDGTYLPLNGATLNRIDYPELANVYGIPSGQSTFSIPSNVQYQPNWTQSDSSKATFIQNKPNIVGDSNGNVIVSGNISAGNLGMFRNRIINGDMRIDQRNAGTAVTAGGYSVDRFGMTTFSIAAGYTQGRVSINDLKGFNFAHKITIGASALSGSGAYRLRTTIEGNNISDLYWGSSYGDSITVSFWVKSSITGDFTFYVGNKETDGTASSTTYQYIKRFTITNANIWQYITFVIPPPPILLSAWNTDNALGMTVCIVFYENIVGNRTSTEGWFNNSSITSMSSSTNLFGTANATFFLTGLQLEKGTIATPFEFRPLALELQLCQRYYEKGSLYLSEGYVDVNGRPVSDGIYYKVTKRVTPISIIYTNTNYYGTGSGIYTAFNYTDMFVATFGAGGAGQCYCYSEWASVAEL
jgi:hypothetical protein